MEHFPESGIVFSDDVEKLIKKLTKSEYEFFHATIQQFYIGVVDLYGARRLQRFSEGSIAAVHNFFDGIGGDCLCVDTPALSMVLRRKRGWGLEITAVIFRRPTFH
jgi:hypothetical protein